MATPKKQFINLSQDASNRNYPAGKQIAKLRKGVVEIPSPNLKIKYRCQVEDDYQHDRCL